MRKALLFMLGLLLALPLMAWAAQGGEGNNTGCNGQGNPNSPCGGQGGAGGNGGNGGAGGAGGSSTSTNTNTNQNVNVNSNAQGQHQKQHQSQSQGQSQSSKNTNSNSQSAVGSGNATSVNVDAKYQAPAVSAPSLAVGSDVCRGSTSFGVSGPMAGLSFGNTFTDEDCQLRAFARSLQHLGYPEAALAILATNPKVAEALQKTGFKAAWLHDEKDQTPVAAALPGYTPRDGNFAARSGN